MLKTEIVLIAFSSFFLFFFFSSFFSFHLLILLNRFNPDRFSAENVKGRSQFAFQPFGLPQRICPGNQFALYELSIFVSLLVRSFKWKLVEGQVVESVHHLVTSPKEEIWVQVEKR